MPSMEETRRQVKEGLEKQNTGPDHDDILKSLQDEIDKHNALKDGVKSSVRRSRRHERTVDEGRSVPSMKFRFKSGTSDPTKRKNRARDERHNRREKRRREDYRSAEDTEASHPFPREPTDPSHPEMGSTDAFRESLFDALADDEGAQYWEGVYNQPIHVYPRPTVQTEKGVLEEMNDEEYAAYVKTKMWEKKNPHIVLEKKRSERQRREAEEEMTREREKYVRRKEQARHGYQHDRIPKREDEAYDHVFTGKANNTAQASKDRRNEFAAAWSSYLEAWDALKRELLTTNGDESDKTKRPLPAKRIPWPVFAAKPVVKANIEDFMLHPPLDEGRSLLQVLKAERVRWHPDKVQQRFRGTVDEGTMKLVTGVFQVVDSLVEEERKRKE